MPQPPESKSALDISGMTDILHVVSAIHLTAFTPLLRTGMGVRALAFRGPLALLWILAYAEATHCGLLFLYLPVWLFACFLQSTFLRSRYEHSRYDGFPILGRMLGENTGLMLEAALLGGLGFWLSTMYPNFGRFVMGGGVAALVKNTIEIAWRNKMAVARQDAAIEAQQLYRR